MAASTTVVFAVVTLSFVARCAALHAGSKNINDTCRLNVTSNSRVGEFIQLVSDEGTKLVYFKLLFGFDEGNISDSNSSLDILSSTKYEWVWANDVHGIPILQMEYNFLTLSLGTLSPGVYYYYNLNVTDNPRACFSNLTDSEAHQTTTKFITRLKADHVKKTGMSASDVIGSICFRNHAVADIFSGIAYTCILALPNELTYDEIPFRTSVLLRLAGAMMAYLSFSLLNYLIGMVIPLVSTQYREFESRMATQGENAENEDTNIPITLIGWLAFLLHNHKQCRTEISHSRKHVVCRAFDVAMLAVATFIFLHIVQIALVIADQIIEVQINNQVFSILPIKCGIASLFDTSQCPYTTVYILMVLCCLLLAGFIEISRYLLTKQKKSGVEIKSLLKSVKSVTVNTSLLLITHRVFGNKDRCEICNRIEKRVNDTPGSEKHVTTILFCMFRSYNDHYLSTEFLSSIYFSPGVILRYLKRFQCEYLPNTAFYLLATVIVILSTVLGFTFCTFVMVATSSLETVLFLPRVTTYALHGKYWGRKRSERAVSYVTFACLSFVFLYLYLLWIESVIDLSKIVMYTLVGLIVNMDTLRIYILAILGSMFYIFVGPWLEFKLYLEQLREQTCRSYHELQAYMSVLNNTTPTEENNASSTDEGGFEHIEPASIDGIREEDLKMKSKFPKRLWTFIYGKYVTRFIFLTFIKLAIKSAFLVFLLLVLSDFHTSTNLTSTITFICTAAALTLPELADKLIKGKPKCENVAPNVARYLEIQDQ